ncbi:MAG: methyltransferase [Clostridia bacterium]|nr:methyltransferase [Clostridia bacterium]
MQDSRKVVLDTLEMRGPSRIPRQLWDVPWIFIHHPEEIKAIRRKYPDDIVWCERFLKRPAPVQGDPYAVGTYIDEWGSRFENAQEGIIGEVKNALIRDEDWEDWESVRLPREFCDLDTDAINAYCRSTDQFVLSGTSARLFERLQFLAGTEKVLMDLLMEPEAMYRMIDRVHQFFCEEIEAWAKTDVDGIFFQDDWGSQKGLLINPKLWEKLFKPRYREYVQIARAHGKKVFMHSDGNILAIYPHLIDIGVDAVNSQIFCMGLENLAPFKGQITFWGEMDRQGIMAYGTPQQARDAVDRVADLLWANGGVIGQMECGVGTDTDNCMAAMDQWTEVEKRLCPKERRH